MRVRRTAPRFTFNLSKRFVNAKFIVSTDIYGGLADLTDFSPIF